MLATTRGAVLRGETQNDLGDEIEGDDVVEGLDDFPLGLTERGKNVQDPASGTWRTIRYMSARVPSNVVLEPGDRIRDNRTGIVYALDDETRTPRSISGRASVTLNLRRTDGK